MVRVPQATIWPFFDVILSWLTWGSPGSLGGLLSPSSISNVLFQNHTFPGNPCLGCIFWIWSVVSLHCPMLSLARLHSPPPMCVHTASSFSPPPPCYPLPWWGSPAGLKLLLFLPFCHSSPPLCFMARVGCPHKAKAAAKGRESSGLPIPLLGNWVHSGVQKFSRR